MAIQMRRGLMDDFDPDKMLPGEWAVSIDRQTERQIVWMCFSPGVTKRMGTYEDFYAQIEEATEGILAEYKAELNVIAQEVRELAEAVSKDREYVASAHTEIKDVYIPQIEGYLTQAEGFRDQAESYSGQAEASAQSASQSAHDASDSADAAEKSEQATAVLAASASQSEKNASQSATQAAASAQSSAADKAEVERLAGEVADDLQEVTELATQAGTDAGRAETAATAAEKSAGTAGEAEKQAKNYSDLSQSYAVGTGNVVRENDETDNSKYYYEQSKRISQGFTGLIPMGTVTFEQLSELQDPQTGWLYNISDAFTSDETFQGGVGVHYGAGSNVYRTADGYWDVLAGNAVTGISIGTNGEMKQGNVTVPTATGDAIGLAKPDGKTLNVGVDGTLSVADGFVPEIKIATTQEAGIVKPDGKTITVADDGTITGASTEFTGTTQEYERAKESGEIADGTIVNITDDYSGGSGGGGVGVTVDETLSEESTNPVQNKAIAKEINELKKSVSDGKGKIAAAITGKGVETAAEDTFQKMAENINNIDFLGVLGIKFPPTIKSVYKKYTVTEASGGGMSFICFNNGFSCTANFFNNEKMQMQMAYIDALNLENYEKTSIRPLQEDGNYYLWYQNGMHEGIAVSEMPKECNLLFFVIYLSMKISGTDKVFREERIGVLKSSLLKNMKGKRFSIENNSETSLVQIGLWYETWNEEIYILIFQGNSESEDSFSGSDIKSGNEVNVDFYIFGV